MVEETPLPLGLLTVVKGWHPVEERSPVVKDVKVLVKDAVAAHSPVLLRVPVRRSDTEDTLNEGL